MDKKSEKSLRNIILNLLLKVDTDQGYSHILIDREIRTQNLDIKDEGLLTEIVYGTIQYKLTLDYYLDSFIEGKKKLQPWVKMLLRMSVYQMVYLDRIPDHAIFNEAVEIAKKRGHKGIASFVNGVLRNIQRNGVPSLDAITDEVERLSIETSHPAWLVNRWISLYGYETTKAMCFENLVKKPSTVRVQPLKNSREEVITKLTAAGYEVEKSAISDQGIIITQGNILKSDLFKDGCLTIQDQSSMLVGEIVQAQPGMHVLDTCSAPGGKVTHIAEKMENKGSIHAFDLHDKKLKSISNRAAELNLNIIETKAYDARKLTELYDDETFDRILVDAPCSGLGVIRSKPDIKYHKQEEDIHKLAFIQLDILSNVAYLLKPDGKLVYSTCTVDTAENESVVKQFLAEHPDFSIDTSLFEELPGELKQSIGVSEYGVQLFPQTLQTDGFFLTRLIKKA